MPRPSLGSLILLHSMSSFLTIRHCHLMQSRGAGTIDAKASLIQQSIQESFPQLVDPCTYRCRWQTHPHMPTPRKHSVRPVAMSVCLRVVTLPHEHLQAGCKERHQTGTGQGGGPAGRGGGQPALAAQVGGRYAAKTMWLLCLSHIPKAAHVVFRQVKHISTLKCSICCAGRSVKSCCR